jgi:hypothetical protein
MSAFCTTIRLECVRKRELPEQARVSASETRSVTPETMVVRARERARSTVPVIQSLSHTSGQTKKKPFFWSMVQ